MTRSHAFGGLISLALAGVIAVAGCAKPPATGVPAPTTGTTQSRASTQAPPQPAGPYGELRMALTSFGSESFKVESVSGDSLALIGPLADWMFWTDTFGGAWKPGVVEKWDVAGNGLSWTLTIRKGIKFHNGDELTAKDVKFSIEQYGSKNAFFSGTRDMVERVELVDPYTVRIFTKGKQPLLPRNMTLTSPYHGLVVPKDYVEKNGWDYFEKNPVGSGSFKLVRHAVADALEYEAVDKHWLQTPQFRRLILVLIPEETTRVAMLRTGAVDVVDTISFTTALELEKRGFQNLVVGQAASQIQIHAAYDPRAKGMPAADIRVRQALSMAINRDEISKTLYYGKGEPPLPPYFSAPSVEIDTQFWLDYTAKTYRYDPAEATRILKEAGYSDGLKIKLYTFPAGGAPDNPKLAEIVQSYWSRIGVKGEIVPTDDATYKKWKNKPVAEPLVGQATTYVAVSLPPQNLKSHFYGKSGTNLVGEAFPEFDKLIDEVFSEMDPAKRKELFGRAVKIATDAYTSLMISRYPSVAALSPAVLFDLPTPPSTQALAPYAAYFKHKK
ncbi:MAG: ABC transporter substrate-binding protein [Chloroflexi bacterium]|nr:ABC transporter substrate-binding protein [Chloroflexota bacterium]